MNCETLVGQNTEPDICDYRLILHEIQRKVQSRS